MYEPYDDEAWICVDMASGVPNLNSAMYVKLEDGTIILSHEPNYYNWTGAGLDRVVAYQYALHAREDTEERPPCPPPRTQMRDLRERKESTPLEKQIDGDHYKFQPIQPVEYNHVNGLGFCEGSVVKYVSRWRRKGGIKDLQKAKHFLELLIELERKQQDQTDGYTVGDKHE